MGDDLNDLRRPDRGRALRRPRRRPLRGARAGLHGDGRARRRRAASASSWRPSSRPAASGSRCWPASGRACRERARALAASLTDTALLAVLLAAIAGVLAGRAWASALRRGEERDRAAFRASPHYIQGLHYLAAGQLELAISELSKVARDEPDAVEVSHVLGNLLRESGQVERAIQVHQAILARPRPGPARARARAGLARHRLPQGRVPRPRHPHLRRGAGRGPAEHPCPGRHAEAARGPARVARGLRDADAAEPPAQDGRQPRARPPADGDGARGGAGGQPRGGGARLPHRALPRPPRVPRPPRAGRPVRGERIRARPRPSWRTRWRRRPSAPTSPSTGSPATTPPPASRRASSPSASASSARTRATGARGSTSPATCARRAATKTRTACSCAPWRRTPT